MRFDSVVFSDTAHLAVLSCFSRLKAEREAGRTTLLIPLVDAAGAGVVEERGLAVVRTPTDLATEGIGVPVDRPWRERIAILLRALGPKHVLAPLGLFGASQSIDYFSTLRGAMSVDKGRDLLFFEERPHCQVPESVPLRLGTMGVRLPPASQLRAPKRYLPFLLRLLTGAGVPPIFGGIGERSRKARALRPAFAEVADWSPHRSLGPKLQPVLEPWGGNDTAEIFDLAAELGREEDLGSRRSFGRRMSRHAASAGGRVPIERYWLSLSNSEQSDSSDA